MFKLNSKIDNVRDYVIYKGKPYYINTSDEIQCGEKKQMLYKTPLSPLATFNGKFYCSEWENNYKIFDENLELIEEGKDKAFLYLSKEFLETYFLDEQQKILLYIPISLYTSKNLSSSHEFFHFPSEARENSHKCSFF